MRFPYLLQIFYRTILICINSTEFRLHFDRFRAFALETYRLYVQEYGWFIMSPSVHKVLIHAAEIQQNLDMPMGAASEGGGELLHRLRKEARLHATRKDSRLHNMQDLFNRCLDISDPLISSKAEKMLNKFRNREELPAEARALLDTGDDPPPPRRAKRARRQLVEPELPIVQQQLDIPAVLEDLDEDEDLGHEDGNETDYEIDLDDDEMDTD